MLPKEVVFEKRKVPRIETVKTEQKTMVVRGDTGVLRRMETNARGWLGQPTCEIKQGMDLE